MNGLALLLAVLLTTGAGWLAGYVLGRAASGLFR